MQNLALDTHSENTVSSELFICAAHLMSHIQYEIEYKLRCEEILAAVHLFMHHDET